MMDNPVFYAADLFCGGGGTSTGFLKAAFRLRIAVWLAAINHDLDAIKTHELNHPEVKHVNCDLEKVDPRAVVPGGWLDLLMASPPCPHFSRARGGRPMDQHLRASVKYILRWISVLNIQSIKIENVAEFREWGPLHRTCICGMGTDIPAEDHAKKCHFQKAIQKRKGEYFHRFIRKLEEHGYVVRYRVLNAADYGDPTTRERLFIRARKGKAPHFPERTHAPINSGTMFGDLLPWRPAREVINLNLKGKSIFNRKKPLVPNTMKKIVEGLFQFNGAAFVIGQQSGSAPRDLAKPLPTISQAGAISLIEPYIIEYHNGKNHHKRVRSLNVPLPTLDTSNRFGLCQPYIIEYYGTGGAETLDAPLNTVTSKARFGLVDPIIFEIDGVKYLLDILFRMLTPRELASAMSFPEDYIFVGNQGEQLKQIGNAVPVEVAAALSTAIMTREWVINLAEAL